MSEAAQGRMTAAAFLDWAEGREGRWELVDGEPVGMAGAKRRHDIVVMNALTTLRPQLRASCDTFTADMAVIVPAGNVRRPDLGVTCGPRDLDGLHVAEPVLVLEVLSPSTRQIDLMRKLGEYQGIASLQYCLFVEPTEVQVILWSRDVQGWASRAYDRMEDVIGLPAIPAVLALVDLYAGLELPPRPRLVT